MKAKGHDIYLWLHSHVATVQLESVYNETIMKMSVSCCLHLQSHFLEHLGCLQDAAAGGHRIFNDQTGFSLVNGALHQALGP